MKPLNIVAYFDGRPGHEKQTKGILDALSEITPTDVISIDVSVAATAFLKYWTAYFFSSLLPVLSPSKPHADLIIGTGSHTHIPMLLDKNSRSSSHGGQKVRTVTCMTPDVLLRNKFDLCCIPMHDGPAQADNVFITIGPPNTVKYEGRQQEEKGLILVGGIDKRSHIWKSEEVVSGIRVILDANPAMNWTISSSPRTPENTCHDLEQTAVSMKNVSFFRAETTPPGWVEEQYALNRTVWVTADSVSMVYEALTAGCSVGVLPVEWLHPDNKFKRSLNYLTKKKMIVAFDSWQNGVPLPALKEDFLHESKRCAEEILRRWWPERSR